MDYKSQILSFLQAEYEKTRWPFFGMEVVYSHFGSNIRDELNQLRCEGKVKAHDGIHGRVIELIIK